MDMFDIVLAPPSLGEMVRRAKEAIARIFDEDRVAAVAWSSGKDSSVVLALVLEVALEAKKAGSNPTILVTSSDTLVESPEISQHIKSEGRKLKAYALEHGLNLEFHVSKPSLMSSWQMRVLTGRGLPPYAGTSSDCSVDLKIRPQRVLRNKLFAKHLRDGRPPVTVLGTRMSESEKRAARMSLAGEDGMRICVNKDGDHVLSPLCHWDTDMVWEFVGEVVSGERETYSDFTEMMRIYADAGGTSCAVVSDAILEGLNGRRTGKCGARTGCWVCQQAHDRSLRTMVETDERYFYARGLVRFNEYQRAIRHDWKRRCWIGRTVAEGYLCVQPDTFHPMEVRRQARMLMQLDYDEYQRALRVGEDPRFSILPLEMLITLDAWWSLTGLARPHALWADWHAIQAGTRFDVPTNLIAAPESRQPDARFLSVGKEWDSSVWDGLRDAYAEGLLEMSNCKPEVADDGLWDVETEQCFDVDAEGAQLFAMFELPEVLKHSQEAIPPGGITSAFKRYMMLGTIQLSHGQRRTTDIELRRTAMKDRLGLCCDYDLNKVLGMSCSYSEMPQEARVAWRHKATAMTAQAALFERCDLAA